MAKSKSFDESKVTRGPDGRFLAQGGPVELNMRGPNPYGGPNYGNYQSSPEGERIMRQNQQRVDMLNQLRQQQGRPQQNYQNGRDLLRQLTSSKPSRRRGSVA